MPRGTLAEALRNKEQTRLPLVLPQAAKVLYINPFGVLRSPITHKEPTVLDRYLKPMALAALRPLARVFIRLGLSPDWLTLLGLILSMVATGAFAVGQLRWGAVVMLLAGICDILDGQVAREGRKESKFGALLDSTTDRYSEIFIYFGIGAYFIRAGEWTATGVLFFALCGSLMVSYVRARAEGLGEECKVGFMQRPERIVALAIGGLFGHSGLILVLFALAVTTNYTVLERLTYIRKKLKSSSGSSTMQGQP